MTKERRAWNRVRNGTDWRTEQGWDRGSFHLSTSHYSRFGCHDPFLLSLHAVGGRDDRREERYATDQEGNHLDRETKEDRTLSHVPSLVIHPLHLGLRYATAFGSEDVVDERLT